MDTEKEINALKAQVTMLYKSLNETYAKLDEIVEEKVKARMLDYRKHCDLAEKEARIAMKQLVESGRINADEFRNEVKDG